MPYKRRTYRKRPVKRRTYRKKSGWGNTAMKALKIASKVAAAVNTEYKYFDTNTSAGALSNAGIYYSLFNPAQGITASTRNGDSVKTKILTIRGLLQMTGALIEEARVIIYWDNENTVNTGSQMLSNAGTALVTMSTKQEDYRYQTKVLPPTSLPLPFPSN